MFSEVLQLLVNGHYAHATAYTVQALEALHQMALDQGTWDNALLLLPTPDPLQTDEFAGTEEEMLAVAKYRKGLADLRRLYTGDPVAGNHSSPAAAAGPQQPTK